jgi:hypothetical protein
MKAFENRKKEKYHHGLLIEKLMKASEKQWHQYDNGVSGINSAKLKRKYVHQRKRKNNQWRKLKAKACRQNEEYENKAYNEMKK